MRNKLKAATLESKFPILSVEHDCIVSKDADLTVCFRVELPELFSLTSDEYEAMHLAWLKALKVLPNYTVIHKQDWFTEETYQPQTQKDDLSFLDRSFERHFNERPFLHHCCYLFLTKTTKERMRQQSNFNTLCRGFLIPKEMQDKETAVRFLESVSQLESIVNDNGYVSLTRLTTPEIVGTDKSAGIIEKYFSLSQQQTDALADIDLDPGEMKIGSNYLCLHTLSDVDDLPALAGTDSRYERLSTDRTDTRLSFASPVGLLLNCNHIYNQYIMIDDPAENLQRFEKNARNMHSLSRYSRSNQINREWIEEYLNEAHSLGLVSVRCHCNVIAWSDDRERMKQIRNEVGSQLAMMECKPRHNTVDLPALYWAGIPGNQADFPAEESFYTFLDHALCFFAGETNYRSSLSPFGIKMVDRISGIPIHLDISDYPMKAGLITNRNKVVLGGSGTGKSFVLNHILRQYYEQNSHILIIDIGNSYQGLSNLIHRRTHGKDGVYFTYSEENPISFNPFFVEDGKFDIEKRQSVKTLILTLWKRENEPPARSEEVALSNAIMLYLDKLGKESVRPCFDTFYEFVRDEYSEVLTRTNVREKDFDLINFLNVLAPFYQGGEYDYLLNSHKNIDLLNARLIVFELDNIKDHPILFPIVTIVIMETFLSKMRRLKGIRKVMLIEEAWKAIAREGMADYIRYLFKTARKHFGEIIIASQELDDLTSSEIVKDSIINNSDCKILLDQRKYANKFGIVQELLGLTDKEKAQILSINMANHPSRRYKEVWIGLGGVQSAVYATEVSMEEYLTYTTEESEKLEMMQAAEKLGGNIELAIRQLAEIKRNNKNS